MPFVLRTTKDVANPVLPDVYGTQTTAARLVYWYYDSGSGRTYFLVFFCRGGKYGCDGLNFFRYAGMEVTEFMAGHDGDEDYRQWKFHPGTQTAQLVIKNFTADNSTDVFTCAAHGYNNDDKVRVRSLGGVVPAGLTASGLYYIVNKTTNTFQLSATLGGSAVNITNNGTGTLKVWKANAGFDDPVQGRPHFFPELNLTFNGISYAEGFVTGVGADTEPTEFEFGFRGRKVADYDADGNYLGNSFSANNARVYADILFNEIGAPTSRLNFASWFVFKQACEKLIWFRGVVDGTSSGTGLTAKYYDGLNFDTFIRTRTDSDLNFASNSGEPVIGTGNSQFSVVWEGKIKAQYSETYTFELYHDDGAKLWIDNNLIIDQWGTTNAGTHTGSIAMTAGALVNIRLEFQANVAPWGLILKWQSASRTQEPVPTSRLYPLDSQNKRNEAHVVFDGNTQAGQGLVEVMSRAPGWHDQDVNGQIKFLPPDREVAHIFLFDPNESNERWNIVKGSLNAEPRASSERPNYRAHYFNDLEDDLLAVKWVEANRDELRERQGGKPSDISPKRWGVMTRSLTSRCGEFEMKVFSDADRDLDLRGQSDSYKVSKGDRVQFAHIATGETLETILDCLVTSEGFAAGPADEKSYTLLPVTFPLVTDEEVEE